MNTFRRTPSGLNNLHIFHSVDFVVFLEGGAPYSKAQVETGKYSEQTLDILFWSQLFKEFLKGKSVKLKSIGSKSVVKEVAGDILNNNLSYVLAAMDREFDEQFNDIIEHPQVKYTYGYSWENDLWSASLIIKLIENFIPSDEIETESIESSFNNMSQNIKEPVYADAFLFKTDENFFPRKGGTLFCIDHSCKKFPPKIVEEKIKQRFKDINTDSDEFIEFKKITKLDPIRYCYGHFLSEYCYHFMSSYLREKKGIRGFDSNTFNNMAITEFFKSAFPSSSSYNYYNKELKSVS